MPLLRNATSQRMLLLVPPVARRSWGPIENDILLELRAAGRSWIEISQELERHTGIPRTPGSCHSRLNLYSNSGNKFPVPNESGVRIQRRWTKEEDKILLQLRAQSLRLSAIAAQLGRNWTSCRYRLQRLHALEKGIDVKRKWTREEDDHVHSEIAKYVHANRRPLWKDIGKAIDRTGPAVQLRWESVLDPTLNRRRWTEEEDACVSEMCQGIAGWDTNIMEAHR